MDDTNSLIEFPCDFPIKVMGLATDGFEALVVELIERHIEGGMPEGKVSSRESTGGKYLSVTVTVQATSRGQLDAIYRDLTACERVLMAL